MTKGLLYWTGFLLPNFSRLRHPLEGRFHFHSLSGPGKIPGGGWNPAHFPPGQARSEKRNSSFFFLLFFFSLRVQSPPSRLGWKGGGVDTPVAPPTQSRPTARVAVAAQVNTYLGNILSSCPDWVKGIFYVDPMDMMHKGGGDPAYFLPRWARQNLLVRCLARAPPRQQVRSEGGLKPRLSTPHPQPARHTLQMSVYMVYSAIQGGCRWAW